jgi:hypothetical protein
MGEGTSSEHPHVTVTTLDDGDSIFFSSSQARSHPRVSTIDHYIPTLSAQMAASKHQITRDVGMNPPFLQQSQPNTRNTDKPRCDGG